MNVRKSENGVKRTREHKEFPAGNDSGLSDLDGMEHKEFPAGNDSGLSDLDGMEHKEFPAGNDSGLSDLDGMERLCCCRKETFCFRQLPQQQV